MRSLPSPSRWRKPVLLGTSGGLALVVGLADYATGSEASFALFYLAPVGLAAWTVGRGAGLAMSVVSALIWMAVNRGTPLSHWWIFYWNALTRVGFFVVVTLLASALRRQLDHERLSARTDELTGLPNRRELHERLSFELLRTGRSGEPFSLLLLDVDDFKRVNDEEGHPSGDALLRRLAQALRGSIRQQDLASRLGGDEFAVLLPATDASALRPAVSRMRAALGATTGADGRLVTVSCGALTWTPGTGSREEVLAEVDRLLYRAKQSGRGVVAFAETGAAKVGSPANEIARSG